MQTHGNIRHLSLHYLPPERMTRRTLLNRLAGERDFRDFSCLSPAKENRCQPVDPAPTDLYQQQNLRFLCPQIQAGNMKRNLF
jgi:hypothetical protein